MRWLQKLRQLTELRHRFQLRQLEQISQQRRSLARYVRVALLVARWDVISRLKLHAQALTYDTLLALVPLLAVVFAIFKGFGGMEQVRARVESMIVSNLAGAPQVQEMVSGYLHSFVDNVQGSQIGAVSIVLLVFSVMSLLGHIEFAFNTIFSTTTQRPVALRFMTYWSILTLGPVLLAASFALTAAMQTSAVARLVDELGGISSLMVSAMPLVVTWIGFMTMYLVVPQTQVKFGSALISAIVAGSLWNAAKYGYAIYAKNAFTLQNIYGSMAAIPLFILWLYVSWLLVLFGAQLTFAFEHAASYHPDEGKPISYAYKERALCRMFLEIACDFYRGNPPTDPKLAAHRFGLSGHHIEEIVSLLKNGLFACEVGVTGHLVPARDLQTITLSDLIEYLRTATGITPTEYDDNQHIDGLLHRLNLQRQQFARTVTFRDLAAEICNN